MTTVEETRIETESRDPLGDRMKEYEGVEAQRRSLRGLPVAARIDGRAFSSYTKGLQRPYDENFSRLMIAVTHYLVQESHATVGYTQSDEISLLFYNKNFDGQGDIFFGGRFQKMTSILASMASVKFNALRSEFLGDFKPHVLPVFDCRVWQLPSLEEAANTIVWREQDATKNSLQSAGYKYFSHNKLFGVSTAEIHDRLHEIGINWNDYPAFFKRGTYVQRQKVSGKLTFEELDLLPEKHHARQNPELEIERSVVKVLDVPQITKITNRVEFLLGGATPQFL